MKSLVAAELLKIRTTSAVWVASALVLAYAVLGPVLVVLAPTGATIPPIEPALLAESLRSPARLAGAAVLLIGLLATTAEFGHGTVLTTRLAEPRSGRVLTAKLISVALVGAVFTLVLTAVSIGASAVLLASRGVSVEPLAHDVPRYAGILLLLVMLHGLLGVTVGTLLRNTAAAVGAVLVWAFVVEGILPVVSRRPEIGQWLPSGATLQMLAERNQPGQLPPAAAAALLLAYTAALVAMAAVTDRFREP
jgi:ABC-2 type transport system permease protein